MSAEEFVKLQLRLPRALHERLQQIADEQERSLNGQLVYLLRKGVEEYDRQQGPDEEGKVAA